MPLARPPGPDARHVVKAGATGDYNRLLVAGAAAVPGMLGAVRGDTAHRNIHHDMAATLEVEREFEMRALFQRRFQIEKHDMHAAGSQCLFTMRGDLQLIDRPHRGDASFLGRLVDMGDPRDIRRNADQTVRLVAVVHDGQVDRAALGGQCRRSAGERFHHHHVTRHGGCGKRYCRPDGEERGRGDFQGDPAHAQFFASDLGTIMLSPARQASRALGLLLVLAAPAEAGQRVSIELVLAVDVSLSVNDIEYALQMKGIKAAFRDKDVIELIGQHKHGVAVTMTQWSGTYDADQPLPWHRLTDEASVLAFAELLNAVPRRAMSNFTGIGHAIAFAAQLINSNAFEGDERKIDISGDGRNNTGPEPSHVRDLAIGRDITINGLAITNNEPDLAGPVRPCYRWPGRLRDPGHRFQASRRPSGAS